jgi:hypothetical protein
MSKLAMFSIALFFICSCKQEQPTPSASDSPSNPALSEASETQKEKPIQHLKIADITSMDGAVKVFNETITKLKSKTKFDAAELHDIHMITYSTEKAIAYFGENLTGEQKEIAKKAAVILEEVHLASEGNKKEATEKNLTEFLALAAQIAAKL